MIRQIGMLVILTALAGAVSAGQRYYIKFELGQDSIVINRGNDYVTEKRHTWSRGLKSSYLKLRCDRSDPQSLKKLFSLVDHFAGLRVTHQLVDERIEVSVVRSVVQNRRAEIHDLPKDECRDLAPILTTVTERYSYPASAGTSESHRFGENMNFRLEVLAVGKVLRSESGSPARPD